MNVIFKGYNRNARPRENPNDTIQLNTQFILAYIENLVNEHNFLFSAQFHFHFFFTFLSNVQEKSSQGCKCITKEAPNWFLVVLKFPNTCSRDNMLTCLELFQKCTLSVFILLHCYQSKF